jgi:Flp pilus assembly protein TadB
MRGGNDSAERGTRLRRTLRWTTSSQLHWWLLTAGVGLVIGVVLTVLGRPLYVGLPVAILYTLIAGAIGSYRLQRRQDASVEQTWVAGPHAMGVPGRRE